MKILVRLLNFASELPEITSICFSIFWFLTPFTCLITLFDGPLDLITQWMVTILYAKSSLILYPKSVIRKKLLSKLPKKLANNNLVEQNCFVSSRYLSISRSSVRSTNYFSIYFFVGYIIHNPNLYWFSFFNLFILAELYFVNIEFFIARRAETFWLHFGFWQGKQSIYIVIYLH